MSDKNIEIIKAILSTGQCPDPTTSTPLTQMVTEGLESSPNTEVRTTKMVFNYMQAKDSE